jgi:hypothetical protein
MKKLLLALLILSSSTLWAEKYALMVGVNNVRGQYSLFTDIDLHIMEKMLKKAGFKTHILKGKNTSLKKVRKAFESFYSLNENDTFLFYYTGHGARMKGINKNEPIDNFFVLNDAIIGTNTISGGILTDNEYSMHLHQISAQKLSIVDACHSASIYKDLSSKKFVKSIIPKGSDSVFKRDNSIQSFQSFEPKNLINISAAQDNQQAESTPIGSIFTVALIQLIQKNPNISFSSLEKKLREQMKPTARRISSRLTSLYPNKYFIYRGVEGKFKPSIDTAPASLKNLRVKDIFVKKKKANPSLASVLEAKPSSLPQETNQLTISTADGKKHYPHGKPIKFNITSKIKEGYLYLFEKKQKNYTLLGERKLQNCQNMGKEKYCKFDNIYASKPFGKSVAYVVVTKKALKINNQSIKKDFEITEEFFDVEEDLATQIKKERVSGISLTLWVE